MTGVSIPCPGVTNKTFTALSTEQISEVENRVSTDPIDTEIASAIKDWDDELNSSYENSSVNCGTANSFTGDLQKGDCSDESLFVTEINEPIGAATIEAGAGIGEEGGIIDAYEGLCCLVGGDKIVDGKTVYICEETRTLTYGTYAACDDAADKCSKIQWLVASTGAGVIKNYVKQLYIFGAGIVGFVAVITMVYSGIQISVSGASGDITAAKERIIQSIMGIALLFFSGLILYTINPTFFN